MATIGIIGPKLMQSMEFTNSINHMMYNSELFMITVFGTSLLIDVILFNSANGEGIVMLPFLSL